MPSGELSLPNFTSIFEIFAGYYLLLGTNKSFQVFFSIVDISKRLKEENKIFFETVKELGDSLVEQQNKIPVPTNLQSSIDWHKTQLKKLQLVHDTQRKVELIEKRVEKWYNQFRLHYSEGDEQQETVFYRFMKPYYIFFGAMWILYLLG